MHEWLITRGEVQGAPFEWRMQIFVPWNCVLVHEGKCHRHAQWSEAGRTACLSNVSTYYPRSIILGWLVNIAQKLTVAREKISWLEDQGGIDDASRIPRKDKKGNLYRGR